MRSRIRNRSLSFTIYSLVFLPFILFADSYHIGYRAIVKDALLVDEVLNISRTMTPCTGIPQSPLLLSTLTKDIHIILKNRAEEFYTYLLSQSLHVSHNETVINNQSKSLTTLTFPTHCFKVDFKGNLAKITLIK